MPAPILGPLIVAGSQIAGAGINAAATGAQNRKSREWATQMYNRQYADNVAFWRMQNDYNSPEQQMIRLKAAGLNPNMVYGGSPGGVAGTADAIKTPDVQPTQFRVPEYGSALMNLGAYIDTEIKLAQHDNLRAQNTVLLGEAALKAAQTANVTAQTDQSVFNLGLDTELRETSAEMRREQLRQAQANRQFTLNEDERKAAQNAAGLRESAERVLTMRAERANTREQRGVIIQSLRNLRKDERLKQLEIELRQIGLNPNSPMYMQILGRVLNQTIGNPVEAGVNWFKDLFK